MRFANKELINQTLGKSEHDKNEKRPSVPNMNTALGLKLLRQGALNEVRIPTKGEMIVNFRKNISEILNNEKTGVIHSKTLKKKLEDVQVENNFKVNYNAVKNANKGLEDSLKNYQDLKGGIVQKKKAINDEQVSTQKFITENIHILDSKVATMLKSLKLDTKSQQLLSLWKMNESRFQNVKTFVNIGDFISNLSKAGFTNSLSQVIEKEEHDENLYIKDNQQYRKEKLRNLILKEYKKSQANYKQKKMKLEFQQLYFKRKNANNSLLFKDMPVDSTYNKDENYIDKEAQERETNKLIEKPPMYKEVDLGWQDHKNDLINSKLTQKKFYNVFELMNTANNKVIKEKSEYYEFYVNLTNIILKKLIIISKMMATDNTDTNTKGAMEGYNILMDNSKVKSKKDMQNHPNIAGTSKRRSSQQLHNEMNPSGNDVKADQNQGNINALRSVSNPINLQPNKNSNALGINKLESPGKNRLESPGRNHKNNLNDTKNTFFTKQHVKKSRNSKLY